MGASGATGLIIAAVALLWVAIGILLYLFAARRLRSASEVLDAARANATLLAIAPTRPLLVRRDGQVDADSQLVRDLGL